MCAGDISYISRREGKETEKTGSSQWLFLSYCRFALCILLLLAQTDQKYFVLELPLMLACTAAITLLVQRDWCHKVPRVKFLHSDAHKSTFTQGRLQRDFKKRTLYGGVVIRLTLLAAGSHGAPTEFCLLTWEWCSEGQMSGAESWTSEWREILLAQPNSLDVRLGR